MRSLDALESALLKARASELTEVRRDRGGRTPGS